VTTVKHPDTLLTYVKGLERRIATLEGASRLAAARVSGGQLNVGAVNDTNQITLDAGGQTITFANGGTPVELSAFGGSGAALNTSAAAGTASSTTVLATESYAWVGNAFVTLFIQQVGTSNQAVVGMGLTDDGAGGAIPVVNIQAVSASKPDAATVTVTASGGMVLNSSGRTTDPPAPFAGECTLYVKSNRLYYVDTTGTVHGPL
jgi:hypothetical protein